MSSSHQRVVQKGRALFSQFFNEVDNRLSEELSPGNAALSEHISAKDKRDLEFHERWPSNLEDSFTHYKDSYISNRNLLVDKKIQSWETRQVIALRNYSQDDELMEKLRNVEKEWHEDLVEQLLVKQLAALVQLRLKMETIERKINPFKIRPRSPYPAPVIKILLQSFNNCQDITPTEAAILANKTGLQESQVIGWFQKRKWAAKNNAKVMSKAASDNSSRVSKAVPVTRQVKPVSPIAKPKQKGKSYSTESISLVKSSVKNAPISPTSIRQRDMLSRQLRVSDSMANTRPIFPPYNPFTLNNFITLDQSLTMSPIPISQFSNSLNTYGNGFNLSDTPFTIGNDALSSDQLTTSSQYELASTDSLPYIIPDFTSSDSSIFETSMDLPSRWDFETCSLSDLTFDGSTPGGLVFPQKDPVLSSYLQHCGYTNNSGFGEEENSTLPSDVFYMLLQQPQNTEQLQQIDEFETKDLLSTSAK